MNNEQKRQELLAQGYIKVGSKTYCEYWKKGDEVITLDIDEEINMNTQEQLHKLELPSDFLVDNYKTLQRRNDFEDIIEDLDDLQYEAMQISFQDGFEQGELNVLRQFVEGKLDRDYVLEMFGDQIGELK